MGEISLRQALSEFMDVYARVKNYAKRTRVEYHNDLEDLVRYLEGKGISAVGSLSLNSIDSYLASLDSRGLAGSTRKRKAITIRMFLAFLFREKYLSNDISRNLIIPFADHPIPRILSQTECLRLLKCCSDNIRDLAIIETFLHTGIKLSELMRLSVADIDLPPEDEPDSGGVMRIHAGSGRRGRIVPLNSNICTTLRNYLAARPASQCAALFLNRLGDPLGDRGVQKLVDKLLSRSEIKSASVHTLRHTFAVHLLINGIKMKTLIKIMGYKNTRSIADYLFKTNDLSDQIDVTLIGWASSSLGFYSG